MESLHDIKCYHKAGPANNWSYYIIVVLVLQPSGRESDTGVALTGMALDFDNLPFQPAEPAGDS